MIVAVARSRGRGVRLGAVLAHLFWRDPFDVQIVEESIAAAHHFRHVAQSSSDWLTGVVAPERVRIDARRPEQVHVDDEITRVVGDERTSTRSRSSTRCVVLGGPNRVVDFRIGEAGQVEIVREIRVVGG